MTLYWRRQIGQHPIYAAQGAFRLTGEGRKPVRASFRQNVPKGKYDVRVRRISPDSTNDRWTLETALAGIKFYQEQPSNTKGQTRVGMTLKASGQLNGSIDRYSAMTVAACPMPGVSYWLGGDPVQNIVEVQTSNPAAWFYKIASGFYDVDNRLLAGLGLPDAEIDIEGLKQWAQFCSLNNLNFNGAFTSKVSAGEALNKIARIGRASISFQSGKLGVIWDSPGQAPVAMFGPHNMLPGTFSISYPSEQTADEIVVRFENEENNYESDTVRVQVPGSLTVGQNPAEIDLFGCTNKVQAAKEANLLAAAQVWRRRRIHWETDLEGLIVTRGDVVLLSHDLTSWGATGRVFSATSATSITLDKPVTGTGTQQWLAFRAPDQLLITYHRVLSFTGEQQTITLLDPLPLVPGADGDHVAADYVWAFDATSTPGKKAKIISIVPTDENRVQITAVDENDEYYLSEDNPYQYAPSVPIVGVIPTITNLKVVVENDPESQAEQIYAYVSWDIIGPNFSEAHIYVRENNGAWTFKGISKQSNFSFPVNPSSTYEIRVTVFGSQGVLGGGNSATIVWSPFDTAPPPVEDLESETGSTITAGQDMRIKWSPSPLTSFYEVTIKAGAFERSVRVEETRFVYTAEDARLDGGPWRSITFEVRAGNAYGLSDPASITLTNPAPAALQGISLQSSFDIAILSFLRPTDADYAGVLVWMDPDPGFTPSSANLVFEGSDNVITLRLPNPSITYYVKAAAYDTFGKDGLNISAALSVKASMIEHADLADDFAELLENLELQNTVKLKNGAIAGIGLATSSPDADEDTSAFIIQANKFGMVLPDTGEVAITTIARSSNTVTATTSAPHGLDTGFGVLVSGVENSSFNGEFIITEVPSTTQLKWVQSASDASSSGGKLRVKPVIPFIFDTDGDVPILSVQGHISADRIRAGTFQAVTGVGSTRVLIDGENERISVNDGTRDRVKLGKLGTGQYGLEVLDSEGNVILSNDGRLGSSLFVGQGSTTLGDIADNAATPSINYIGDFAEPPDSEFLKENSVYRNTQDGHSYILNSNTWQLFIERGKSGHSVQIISDTGSFRVDNDGVSDPISIRLQMFLNGAPSDSPVTWEVVTAESATLVPDGFDAILYYENMESAQVTIRGSITVDGETLFSQITVVKIFDGTNGERGETGSLGSLTGYGDNYGMSPSNWNDNLANRVIHNMLTGSSEAAGLADTSHLLIGDTVTLSNGTDFAETRYWDGVSSWRIPAVVFHGDVLIDGTVSATKLTAGEVSTGQAGNAGINIGNVNFIGSSGGQLFKSPLHVTKKSSSANQVLISALNDKDESVPIWGASAHTYGNAVSGTWHATLVDAQFSRWQMIGILGGAGPEFDAAVAGNAYGQKQAGAFRYFDGPNSATPGSALSQVGLCRQSYAILASGIVSLMGGGSPLRMDGDDGEAGQVLTSNGPGMTPSWTTVSGGGGTVTYSQIQSAMGTAASSLNLPATFRATGVALPSSGAGLEIAYDAGVGYVISYDRSAGAYKQLNISGSTVLITGTISIEFSRAPTFPTPATSTNNTTAATTAYVVSRIAQDAPTKSGSGATGTWPISITGNASYASTAGTASSAVNSNRVLNYKCFGGQGTANGSGNFTVNFPEAFTSANTFGVSAVSTDKNYVVVTAVSASSVTFQVQARSTGNPVANAGIRWTAVGT